MDYVSKSLSKPEALKLLHSAGCSQRVIEHCEAVSKLAVEIASKIKAKGFDVDLGFVEVAALLHDIGRSKDHGIRHGVLGAELLSDHPRYARVCEIHIGAGLTKEEATELGLPAREYMLESLEEKIIAHADNLILEAERVSIEERIKNIGGKLGRSHPALKRMRELNDYIDGLID